MTKETPEQKIHKLEREKSGLLWRSDVLTFLLIGSTIFNGLFLYMVNQRTKDWKRAVDENKKLQETISCEKAKNANLMLFVPGDEREKLKKFQQYTH